MAKHAANLRDLDDSGEFDAIVGSRPPAGSRARGEEARPAHRRGAPDPAPHAAGAAHTEAQAKQRRSRRALKAMIALLVVVIVAVGAAGVYLVVTDSQRTELAAEDRTASTDAGTGSDASTPTESSTEVPNLATVVGATVDEAVAALGHGATVTNTNEIDEEDSSVRSIVTIELADEPTDSRTGTPSVYLSLDESGAAIEVSYAAGMAQLGYGSMSFADAVEEAHAVETTLTAAGVPVQEGSVALPEDPTEYTTYGDDGSIRSERYSFTGATDVDGTTFSWSVSLVYDYATTSSSGSIADTTRRLTLTLSRA